MDESSLVSSFLTFRLANFQTAEHYKAMDGKQGGAMAKLDSLMDQTLTWKDVKWLQRFVIVKHDETVIMKLYEWNFLTALQSYQLF